MIGLEFLKDLGLIIIAAAVFAFAGKWLRLPGIVVYLLAGLVLGPLTGLVEPLEGLELISEVGIVLLLFLVGLELSVDKVRDVGGAAVVIGLGQVIVTGLLGYGISMVFGLAVVQSLFLAGVVTFSSTVVGVKLLDQKKAIDAVHGKITLSVLLIQDLVVIVALTLLAGLGDVESVTTSATIWHGLGSAFGGMGVLVVAVSVVSRFVLPRVFEWAARSAQILFIWSICWCFLVVLAAHALHLSHEVGAFLAGISLAQLPYNRDLHRRVHPLMSFFIAVFFVTLGVKMQLGAALDDLSLALVVIAVVLVCKPLIVYALVRWQGYSGRDALFAGITLGQVSEFSFLLAALGAHAGLVSAQFLSMVGLVGLVTMSLSAVCIVNDSRIYLWIRRRVPWLLPGLKTKGKPNDANTSGHPVYRGHIIVVGMNSLGRNIVAQLAARGERVLAVDTDPMKLEGLPSETLLGNVEYLATLEEAGLPNAKLLVSALQIEDANELLAYRCQSFGVPSSIHAVDMQMLDNLLALDVNYLMLPKVDGIKLLNSELKALEVIP